MTDLSADASSVLLEKYPWHGHRINDQWIRTESGQNLSSLSPNDQSLLTSFNISKSCIDTAIDSALQCHLKNEPASYNTQKALLDQLYVQFQDYYDDLLLAQQFESGKRHFESVKEMELSLSIIHEARSEKAEIWNLSPANAHRAQPKHYLSPRGVSAVLLPNMEAVSTFIQFFIAATISNSPTIFFTTETNSLTTNILLQMTSRVLTRQGFFTVYMQTSQVLKAC